MDESNVMDESKEKEEVWQAIQALTRAWTVGGNVDKFGNFFHRYMVAITPTARERIEGREACLASMNFYC